MIKYVQGNLLEADAEVLVNAVNTVGVMGKGIALMFKLVFLDNYRLYARACRSGKVQTGKMFVTRPDDRRWIVNFPTKQHWRNPSQMAWIVEGLRDLRRFLLENEVKSAAIPALGCANGGLKWPEVRAQIEQILGDLPLDLQVFLPNGGLRG